MPEAVAHDFTGSGLGVDELQLDASFSDGSEGFWLPVCLQHLFPHNRVELPSVLIGEDEAHVIVVDVRVDEERALEIDAAEAVQALRYENTLITFLGCI